MIISCTFVLHLGLQIPSLMNTKINQVAKIKSPFPTSPLKIMQFFTHTHTHTHTHTDRYIYIYIYIYMVYNLIKCIQWTLLDIKATCKIDLTLLQAYKQLLIRFFSIVFEVMWNLFNMLMTNSPFCCVNSNSYRLFLYGGFYEWYVLLNFSLNILT
jgi:hypothetical protein